MSMPWICHKLCRPRSLPDGLTQLAAGHGGRNCFFRSAAFDPRFRSAADDELALQQQRGKRQSSTTASSHNRIVSPESPRCKACYALVHEAASLAGSDDSAMYGGAARRAPPAKLVLSGDVQHKPECLGVYRLVAGREAHGWPVWKHVSKDRWIARIASGTWMVQRE